MGLAPGTRLGVYEIAVQIGVGGMGEVYRALDTRLRRDVAIKVLPEAFTRDAERLSRFEREARVLASLNHPNIAAIYGLEDAGGVQALVLELVDGVTLAEHLARRVTSTGEALPLALQIALALEAAHGHGIVHRDLKPANVKVRPDGTVKVLDFGLAKVVHGEPPPDATDVGTMTGTSTAAGRVLGTPAYMSPEQASGHPIDRRTDIWAFGCVLFEMLTGRRAFAGETVSATLSRVLAADPDWSALSDDVPPALRRMLYRCLAKDPTRRLHDIADARIEIEDAIAGPAGASSADQALGGSRKYTRASLASYALGGALAAGLVGVTAATIIWRDGAPERTAVSLSVLPAPGTTFPATGPWPVVAPDGRHIVFVGAPTNGEQRLWLRPIDSTVSRSLPGTEGAIRPFWSPDSRSIGFFANGQLRRVDIQAGVTRVIADAPYSGGLSGAWGDGIIVFKRTGGLYRISPAGGEPRLLIGTSDEEDPLGSVRAETRPKSRSSPKSPVPARTGRRTAASCCSSGPACRTLSTCWRSASAAATRQCPSPRRNTVNGRAGSRQMFAGSRTTRPRQAAVRCGFSPFHRRVPDGRSRGPVASAPSGARTGKSSSTLLATVE